jgi:CHASE3 domain sensor protein
VDRIQNANKVVRFGLFVPLIVIFIVAWLSWQATSALQSSLDWISVTYQVLNKIEETLGHLTDAETGQRGFALTGRDSYLEPYNFALTTIDDDLRKLKLLTADSPAQQENIAQLQPLVEKHLRLCGETIASRKAGKLDPGSLIKIEDQEKQTMDRIRAVMQGMRAEQQSLLIERQAHAKSRSAVNQVVTLALVGIDIVVLIAIVLILRRLANLHRLVTVCAWTSQVKYKGQWIRFDDYLHDHFGVSITHGLSHEAAVKMRQELAASRERREATKITDRDPKTRSE